MYKNNHQLIYSPTDLTTYLASPFASWMHRLQIENPELEIQIDEPDALLSSLQSKGLTHEQDLLEHFQVQGKSITKIPCDLSFDEKKTQTLQAISNGVDVIYQAALSLEPFQGYADFLIRTSIPSKLGDYSYEVWDSKLSKSLKPEYVIQLCCYVEMLQSIQGTLPQHIVVALGSGDQTRLRTADYYHYYQAIKTQFIESQENFESTKQANPADSKSFGRWSSYAEQLLKQSDHLSLIANISRSQIKKLNRAGIQTVKELVESPETKVSGIRAEQFDKLKQQATIQKQSNSQIPPLYEVLKQDASTPTGLALLPPHSPNDVFFDIEGFPLVEGGLEYLWGSTYFDEQSTRQFKDFWAHDSKKEKQAFSNFINWVYQRWLNDPTMHIYHYAPYEVTACKRLMGRHGVCEEKVDQLLRNNVFIDLYFIVKNGLRIGEPRYSIKNVEHLYRGKRETDVGTGSDSVVVYDAWRNQPDGDDWQSSKILNSIRDYNIDDCNSTQELTQWLRNQQLDHHITYNGNQEIVTKEIKEDDQQRHLLRDTLLTKIESLAGDDAVITENLAWMLEFHNRELKPTHWRKFERMDMSEDELYDDMDCLAYCTRTDKAPFKLTPRTQILAYEYQFNPNQEFKGAAKSYFVLGYQTDDGKELKATFVPEHSQLAKGIITLKMKQELKGPITLLPDEFVNPEPIPTALSNQIQRIYKGKLNQSAITDFLYRRHPRIKCINYGEAIIKSHQPDERLNQIIDTVINLDNSYLTIQGPPGAGKTYTAKHIIAELMKLGKKVGISSNSHKAINNLLISTAQYCKAQNISADFTCTSNTDSELQEFNVNIVKNPELINHLQPSCVIGSTAWGFAREDLTDEFDYLFIDEAGQVSVANLVAMSQSTKNIVLMGDQMQLGQPTQGTHPLDSGLSILDYLLKDSPTIPPEMGVFLETTYRMHSKINQFISDAIYNGELKAHPDNDKQVIKVPENYQGILNFDAGVKFIPVKHEGNTQASNEEVDKIKSLVNELLGRLYTDKSGQQHPITVEDMLFIAPYNHQRNKLQQALGDDAKVGTVDKFQGQEAPIVFFSLCTSDASESPRGIDFLFDKHRINVAISRAQSMAIIVSNPKLFTTPVSNIEQMAKVSVLTRLLEY
jgi:uncharacterized protein